MAVDFRNRNTIWASVAVETLAKLGLQTAVICPGSRSTPLTTAFAAHPDLEAIPVLDERSAAFFALGLAKRTRRATALVCTSGTAAANFYPAVVEARESRVPLLVFTADRPPELRHCQAGQAIDQLKLYGHYPTWQTELALPELKVSQLHYLRQTIAYAWERTRFPVAGAVHLNCPFRDPLPPLPEPEAQAFASKFPEDFFEGLTPRDGGFFQASARDLDRAFSAWHRSDRGLIVAGVAQPANPEAYCQAVAHFAKTLGFPVLAEGLSPLRNYASLNPHLVSTYDLLLRDAERAKTLVPEVVVQLGDLPTSKVLREWLAAVQPQVWVVDDSDRNLDPLHGNTTVLRVSVERLPIPDPVVPPGASEFCREWCQADAEMRQRIDRRFSDTEDLVEPKLVWTLSQILPPATRLFVANSMPVRDLEWFWQPSDRRIRVWCNRGANGIDGALSSAFGVAWNARAVLLTGDLALFHDTNGFLLRQRFRGHLTVVLVNNQGGGIFEMLPISKFDPPFEAFFATPQSVDVPSLCRAYGVQYEAVESWQHLTCNLKKLPKTGVRLLELKTDRKVDAAWRQRLFDTVAKGDTAV
ncbi:2-succinyl-5-enolpyruvyl-6-hydroxy-3-cyclohexene-1-carboxylic-acid synthase [Baaleninema sp.]|uniref:2-succinyl-5-enolpyruvyl-6-hydroxy-3- cyclohexene-1-carboxylic-acid synthase n=1 Tax=Baaleninema sp. TaxID=3101197 RepID=UPI003D071351